MSSTGSLYTTVSTAGKAEIASGNREIKLQNSDGGFFHYNYNYYHHHHHHHHHH